MRDERKTYLLDHTTPSKCFSAISCYFVDRVLRFVCFAVVAAL